MEYSSVRWQTYEESPTYVWSPSTFGSAADRVSPYCLNDLTCTQRLDAVMPSLTSNRVLDALPAAYREELLTRLERIALPSTTLLYLPRETPRYAHFLISGVASQIALMEDGRALELGIVGSEGLVETTHLLGPAGVMSEGLMQVGGTALRMPFGQLRHEFLSVEPLRRLLLEQVKEQTVIGNQLAACNYFHSVRERLTRWLLMIQDRVHSAAFHVTQAFLAETLGVQRPTVTLVAGELQRSGLIMYSRGEVRICNRAGLEKAACECYRIIAALQQGSSDKQGPIDANPR